MYDIRTYIFFINGNVASYYLSFSLKIEHFTKRKVAFTIGNLLFVLPIYSEMIIRYKK